MTTGKTKEPADRSEQGAEGLARSDLRGMAGVGVGNLWLFLHLTCKALLEWPRALTIQ